MRRIEPIKLLLWGCILAPTLLLTVLLWRTYDETFRSAEVKVHHLSDIMEQHVAMGLKTFAASLQFTDRELSWRGVDWAQIRSDKSLWEELKALQEIVAQADSIFVVDPEGQLALITKGFPAPPGDYSDRDFFQAHRDNDDPGLFISDVYEGKRSGRLQFQLTFRRQSPDGRFNGVIGGVALFPFVDNQISMAELSNLNVSVSLVNENGTVLASFSSIAKLEHILKALPQSAPSADAWKDENSLVWTRQVADYPLYLRYVVDERSLLLAWLDDFLTWALLAIALGCALIAMGWLALKRSRAEGRALADLKEQMRLREETESKLLHSHRMEAIGQLTGGVAHDFNNILQIVNAACNSLRRHGFRGAIDEKARASLDHIVEAVKRGAHLTRHLLSFSRRQLLNPRPIDLRQEIFAVAPLIERTLRGGIKMHLVLGDDLWPVEVDPFELELALINVGANARDAMADGGQFELNLKNVTLQGNETREELAGDFVALVMRDTGTGMSEEVVNRAFEPFFTTKDAEHGTGLGLSHLYGFARQSGGAVTIDSRLGEGTSITLYLPRTKKIVVTTASPPATAANDTARNQIVVEDKATDASLNVATLRGSGS